MPSLGLGQGSIADDDVETLVREQLDHDRDGVEIVGQIGVGEDPARPSSGGHPRLEGGELAAILGQPEIHEPIVGTAREDLGCPIGGAVVDDDDLGVESRRRRRIDSNESRVGEKGLAVEDRNTTSEISGWVDHFSTLPESAAAPQVGRR